MYDEPELADWADWADPYAGPAAEDEDAARRFVAGPGRGLDIRTVRGFLAECRRHVGPEPILELSLDMAMDGVRYEWGVWFRPRHGGSPHDGWSERFDAVAPAEPASAAEPTPATVDSPEAEDAFAGVAAPLPALSAMSTRPTLTTPQTSSRQDDEAPADTRGQVHARWATPSTLRRPT